MKVFILLCALCGLAAAHDVRGEVIFLDVGDDAVELELRVPTAQLQLAKTDARDALTYVQLHAEDGRAFAGSLGTITTIDNEVRVTLRFTPPEGATARWFRLSDELVLHTVVNANVYAFLRRDIREMNDSPTLVGTMHYQQRSLDVDRTAGSWFSGLTAAFHLGLDHIREGTDHLMVLLALLVVAPLAARGRQWERGRRGLTRVVAIATAFTLGHSLTLALGAVGGIALPTKLVESLIAVSILVSAVHAWRPLFAGKEPLVAGLFGLVHGLAFATALSGFGFDRGSLIIALLGFNLGVEAMQLLVIAMIVPSLVVLARLPVYSWFRRLAALTCAGAALIWLYERTTGATTAISPLFDRAAAHGIWIAVALAGVVLAASLARPHTKEVSA